MTRQAKLVRYESAVLLGMNYARLKNVPGVDTVYNHVMDTLIQNLNDKDIKIYTGASSGVVGGGPKRSAARA